VAQCPVGETPARQRFGGPKGHENLDDMSRQLTALLKRLRKSEQWLYELCCELFEKTPLSLQEPVCVRRIRLVDATHVKDPGKMGTPAAHSLQFELAFLTLRLAEAEFYPQTILDWYRLRWQIELVFRQLPASRPDAVTGFPGKPRANFSWLLGPDTRPNPHTGIAAKRSPETLHNASIHHVLVKVACQLAFKVTASPCSAIYPRCCDSVIRQPHKSTTNRAYL
jgi:hypothetical protein